MLDRTRDWGWWWRNGRLERWEELGAGKKKILTLQKTDKGFFFFSYAVWHVEI